MQVENRIVYPALIEALAKKRQCDPGRFISNRLGAFPVDDAKLRVDHIDDFAMIFARFQRTCCLGQRRQTAGEGLFGSCICHLSRRGFSRCFSFLGFTLSLGIDEPLPVSLNTLQGFS